MFIVLAMDFGSLLQTITIVTGTNNSTVNILVYNDTVVEGDETFDISLTVPSLLGPGITSGSITKASVIIIDTTSKLCCQCDSLYNVVTNS